MLAIVHAGIDAVAPDRLLAPVAPVLSAAARAAACVRVLAAGKAAARMATAVLDMLAEELGDRIAGGLVVAPTAIASIGKLDAVEASHPVPDARSQAAAQRALAIAHASGDDDLFIVLLSGGASALMALPAQDVTLDDKRRTTDRLLRGGADIHALNGVRKHLSAIKGGLLAAACRATTRTYVISDVVTDDLSAIGSGPTVPDPTTFGDALNTLDRFGGRGAYPPSVIERLERGRRGEVAETPKPGDPRLTRAHATIVGSRADGMAGAAREASSRGYRVETLADPVTGEARLAALAQAEIVAARRRPGVPTCIISSGETTVHVTGDGRGGRNLEFALAVATRANTFGVPFAAASVGTDGVDGPTDAAGALVDDTTLDRARAAGLGSPERVLAANDSYSFFEGLDDLIHTGPTGTNVGDLQVFLLV